MDSQYSFTRSGIVYSVIRRFSSSRSILKIQISIMLLTIVLGEKKDFIAELKNTDKKTYLYFVPRLGTVYSVI